MRSNFPANIAYDTADQRKVFKLLYKLRIMTLLQKFNSCLVGSFPMKLNLSSSDIDIICEVYEHELDDLISSVKFIYGSCDSYSIREFKIDDKRCVTLSFF